MSLYAIGTLCVKTMGRDAGKLCIIVDTLKSPFVLIDGQTRRRKCNIEHLEPLKKSLDVKKNASSAEVKKAFETLAITLTEKKARTKAGKPSKNKSKKRSGPVKK